MYQSPEAYPQLAPFIERWAAMRDEALALSDRMLTVNDDRAAAGTWRALPLRVEEEDRGVVPQALLLRNRTLAPATAATMERASGILACSFSALAPGARIRRHVHHQPHVTASLCLQADPGAQIIVDGARRDYVAGEVQVFDYTLPHEVVNPGPRERIVLLLLMKNRWRYSGPGKGPATRPGVGG